MAKTDWQMGDIVQPADLNQIGQEINSAQEKADSALPASQYTAADILEKIKTVDGAGSGLDADLFQGMDSSRFIFGDLQYGTVNYAGDLNNITKSGFYYATGGHTNSPTGTNGFLIHTNGPANADYAFQIFQIHAQDRAFFRRKSAGTWSQWTEIAKTTDFHAYLPTTGGIMTGGILFNINEKHVSDLPETYPLGFTMMRLSNGSANGWPCNLGTVVSFIQSTGSGNRLFQIVVEKNTNKMWFRNVNQGGTAWNDFEMIWNSGTDGAGSGLDADMVDGLHASSFALKNAQNEFTANQIFSGDYPIIMKGQASDTAGKRNFRWDISGDELRLQSLDDNLTYVRGPISIKHDGPTTFNANVFVGGDLYVDGSDAIIRGNGNRNLYFRNLSDNINRAVVWYDPTNDFLGFRLYNASGSAVNTFRQYSDRTVFEKKILVGSNEVYHAGNLASDRTRKITISQNAPSGGSDGDIWIQY